MKLINKIYLYLHNLIFNGKFVTFYRYRIKKILSSTIKFYIPFASIFILIFSVIYYYWGGLAFIHDYKEDISFIDAFYFSTVTFFTLGFGDIRPITSFTKIMVIVQEFFSFIMLTLFSGFIVATFFVRRNDVFFHNELVIRHNGNHFVLSFPIMNQGAIFYDMNASLSLTLMDKEKMINRYSLIHNYTTWFRKVWFCEFDISIEKCNDKDHHILYEIIYMILSGQSINGLHAKFKLSIHGTDSETRDIAYYIKEYFLEGISLKLIDNFISTNRRLYASFGKYESFMDNESFFLLIDILQNMLFPNNESKKESITELYEIENKFINSNNMPTSMNIYIN